MGAWLSERSWRRLITAWAFTLLLVFTLSAWAASAQHVRIVAFRWGVIVLVQYAIQLAFAVLADFAYGREKSPAYSAAMATFGLALSSLASFSVLPFKLLFGGQAELQATMHKTLLGAVLCSSSEAACGDTFIAWLHGWVIVLAIICIITAILLRVQGKDRHTSSLRLALVTAFVFTAPFLLLNEWAGTVEMQPAEVPPTSQHDAFWSKNFGPVLGGIVVAILLMQMIAVWMTLAILRRQRPSPPRYQDAAVAILAAGRFLLFLLFDLLGFGAAICTAIAFVSALAVGFQQFLVLIALAMPVIWEGGRAAVVVMSDVSATAAVTIDRSTPSVFAWAGRILLGAIGSLALVFLALGIWRLLADGVGGLGRFASAVARSVGQLVVRGGSYVADRPTAFLATVMFAFLFFIMPHPPSPPGFSGTPAWMSFAQPEPFTPAFEFRRLSIDCNDSSLATNPLWAFNSADSIVHEAGACRFVTDEPPTMLIVLGTASRDDTAGGGVDLSVKRGRALARLARSQFPSTDTQIIVAALGREVSGRPAFFGEPYIYAADRQVMAIASFTKLSNVPLRHDPVDQTAADLLRSQGLLERYEQCAVFHEGWAGRQRRQTVEGRRGKCRWLG